jgi:hypothetical protein
MPDTSTGSASSATTNVEDEVLALRMQGKSFAGIARSLGLERPFQANNAFIRALRRQPVSERDSIRRQELVRLDALADAVRANHELAPAGVARRLRTLDRLRAGLIAD